MLKLENIKKEYLELLNSLTYDESNLDYSLLERHKTILSQLARVTNSGITVFDLYRKTHVFASDNFVELFGHCTDGFDIRVHPDDEQMQVGSAVEALRFLISTKADMGKYKLMSEYRIQNQSNRYVRVIEQFSLLEADRAGNPWLALCVIDLSPDQSSLKTAKSVIKKLTDNTFISVQKLYSLRQRTGLSLREIEILKLIKEGKISKEISSQLFISVHTVNTHRQRILEKLDADNSLEAVKYASALGLLE
ncbi:MAG: helix-turn-helix transcriptional regulator [Prevotellaceae bacterium]|jgi:DNA-binding CsgD family transcriptional regulator|nr:helix-turn-helix transcriptional regulator [Prevotellaceae bacterium]